MTERVIWEASSLPYLVQERRLIPTRLARPKYDIEWETVARFQFEKLAEDDAISRAKSGAYTRVIREE
ncbi:hypothetical protein [Gulosibacter molinativorax]|uniref:Uncharacterized protein n=1 Tax=Gulosibacter molinativorax TaxID=256821 RepID=A0ABT7C962_9MICO|nr:hypothetical protein [Gulosibacter molinativorax]MDJ1371754.1 hypothetical protein [Gulosibacter molinativorax]QUY60881.1 Hypotetical protein [Gulosibacter molinativorax]